MFAGPSGCHLPETYICGDCLAGNSVSDTGGSPEHTNPEVGIYTALQYLADTSQRDLRGAISDILSHDVSNQTQSVVQDQEEQEGNQDSLGPKPAPVEPV